jgi:hypothetical protein
MLNNAGVSYGDVPKKTDGYMRSFLRFSFFTKRET